MRFFKSELHASPRTGLHPFLWNFPFPSHEMCFEHSGSLINVGSSPMVAEHSLYKVMDNAFGGTKVLYMVSSPASPSPQMRT